ncbi:MAG TPA: hypothetical protein VK436_03755 [Methanocella sp.]|nr:hypothetical protein [Methanocella sp.]
MSKDNLVALAIYAMAIVACVLFLAWTVDLWGKDLSLPFSYDSDAIWTYTTIKTIQTAGWYLQNPLLGAPFGSYQLFDFPQTNNLDALMIKAILVVTGNAVLSTNIYFLLTFPLTTVTTLFLLRQLKISFPVAVPVSLLFTFLPYHFLRGISHLYLSSYYTLPLMALVLLWIYNGEQFMFKRSDGKIKLNLEGRAIASIIICLLISSADIYYPFFACVFLLIVGISGMILRKDRYVLISSSLLILIIVLGVLINLSPCLIYWLEHGMNTEVGSRNPLEAEIYGLKVLQLLMPIHGYRIQAIADLVSRYDAAMSFMVNENSMASLGVMGSIGFIVLIIWAIFRKSGISNVFGANTETMDGLSLMNLAAILLATTGGFAPIIGILFPYIRGYNRISVFVALFSLISLAILLQTVYARLFTSSGRKVAFCMLMSLLLLAGVLDQTTAEYIPHYTNIKADYSSDDAFIKQIETSMPAGAMIYQMPYMSFPENSPINRLGDYQLFNGYLHSDTLRWSYGATRGRTGDAWLESISNEPPDEMVRDITIAGFSGVYLDSRGYSAEDYATLNANLLRIIGTKPLISSNGVLAFYDLSDYADKLKSDYTPDQWKAMNVEVIDRPLITWGKGSYWIEGSGNYTWRWCSRTAELNLYNPYNRSMDITLNMTLATGFPDGSHATVSGPGFTDQNVINETGSAYSRRITIPMGKTTLVFSTDAGRVNPVGEPVDEKLRVINFNYSVHPGY